MEEVVGEEISAITVLARMDNNNKGFTFIELIIVVFVLLLFTGLTIANYGNFNEEKKLEDELKRLSSVLHLARTKAVAADADPNLPACADFKGYYATISAASYKLERSCAGTPDEVQTYSLPANIISKTTLQILFKPLNAGTDLPSVTTVTLRNNILDKCIDIQISPSGTIKEGTKYTSGC